MNAIPQYHRDDILPEQRSHRQKHKARARQTRFVPKVLPAWSELNGKPVAGRQAAGQPESEQAIRLYLREVGRVEVLTVQQETRLVAQARRGNRKAREHLIKGNLRRVVEISRDYENIGLPLLDLISEGNVGLMKAIERFDPGRGTGFAAHSTWWVRQSIKRALAGLNRNHSVQPLMDTDKRR